MSNIEIPAFDYEKLTELACEGPSQGIVRVEHGADSFLLATNLHGLMLISSVDSRYPLCDKYEKGLQVFAEVRRKCKMHTVSPNIKEIVGPPCVWLTCPRCEGTGQVTVAPFRDETCRNCHGNEMVPSTGNANDRERFVTIEGRPFNLNLIAEFLDVIPEIGPETQADIEQGMGGWILYFSGISRGVDWELFILSLASNERTLAYPPVEIFK